MILSESEKNRIRGLHKKHSVIKEQQGTFMTMVLDLCNNGGALDLTASIHVTLNGQQLTQDDIGKEVVFTNTQTGQPLHGAIQSIAPSDPGAFTVDFVEQPCPPFQMPPMGIVMGSCDSNTTATNLDFPVTLNGNPVTQADVGKEILFVAQGVTGRIDSLFLTTNPNMTPFDAIEQACPAPAVGIMFGSCDPNTTATAIPYPVTLNGQQVTQADVGKEITPTGYNAGQVFGRIDSLILASNPSPSVDFTEAPCPPPTLPPMGIIFGSCDPNTTPTQIPIPISVNGVPVSQSDVGKEIVVNPGPQQTHGRIDSLLVATQNLNNMVDVIEAPCPPPQTMNMGIELKLCGQPNTMPMTVDAAVTIDGQPVTQGDVGKEVSGGGPNTHGTVDSVFIATNQTQVASFISEPCTTQPPGGDFDEKEGCKEFMSWDITEQKDWCYSEKCKKIPAEQMCKCCRLVGL